MLHPKGFIHGRFQVLHKDHLRYLLAGAALCDHLIVGITNPTIDHLINEKTNPARSSMENNPLTYEERKTMINAAFKEQGLAESSYSIVPFPISNPEALKEHAPKDAVYYLTIYDDWGKEKKRRLESLGLTTHIMWEKPESEKGINGTTVRSAIRSNDNWRDLVTPAVAVLIEEWALYSRFNSLSSSTSGS